MRWLRSRIVLFLGILVLVYTFVPIFIVIMMSFNKLPSEQSKIYKFNTFTFDNWLHPCTDPSMCSALKLSVEIGLLATLGATILGTLAAFALVRHDFAGRSTTNIMIFLPMATPEIVMGSSLLALFVAGGVPLGFWTIVIAHIMFCLSFVVVTVRSRLAGLSDTLEQAAADLYATPAQTFRRVTFPLVLPGIAAAAMLSFSLSFDDFIITNLNAGNRNTFPMYVWGVSRKTIPMQINVVGTVMLLVSVLIVVGGELRSRARRRALTVDRPGRKDKALAAAGARSAAGTINPT